MDVSQSSYNLIDLSKRLSMLKASPMLPELEETKSPCPRCASLLMKLEDDRTGSRFCAFCGFQTEVGS